MKFTFMGIVSLILGLALLAMATYGYYEEHENKPIPTGLIGLLYRYKMGLAIGGAVLLILGIFLLYYGSEL